jgi:DNA-directed RNA polymerase subunit RPC12/RpoP
MIDDSPSAIVERIKKNIEEKRKREDIICPYCQHKQDNETKYHYVTYWGDDPEKECQCEHCSKMFFVKEEVERQFMCRRAEDESSTY